jgi:DNA (cytosine-5)-methyltransferase 1
MARAGLGKRWKCLIANDIDKKKAASYTLNWGADDLLLADIGSLSPSDIPSRADLAWASFPCQDLSLAGAGAGIRAERSGTFWPFWELMRSLNKEGRGPKTIVIENVYGAITSHQGKDFSAIASAFSGSNYRFGAVVVDAVHFVPQSRPRLFVLGVHPDLNIPSSMVLAGSNPEWHPRALIEAHLGISSRAASKWMWWNLPYPRSARNQTLADIIEEIPQGVKWNTAAETKRLLSMMTEVNLEKVKKAKKTGRRVVGAIYRRTRGGIVRAEVRFDDIAGCLRTPAGGSSRQTIIVVEGRKIRSRLVSTREAARLMGLPDSYSLPSNYNDAYHLAGDGVAVPVVRHLASNLLEPILAANRQRLAVA